MDVASVAVFVQAFSRQLLLVPPPPFSLLLLSVLPPSTACCQGTVPLAYEETFSQLLSFICVRALPSLSSPSPPLLPPQVRPLARRLGGRRTGPHPGRVWRASLAAGDRPPAALAVG